MRRCHTGDATGAAWADSLRWNTGDLVEMAVTGQVSQPAIRQGAYLHWPDGRATTLPGMYGIAYNARVGDRAFGWAADHVEPGVSIAHPDERADLRAALPHLHRQRRGGHERPGAGCARGSSLASTPACSSTSRPRSSSSSPWATPSRFARVGRGIRLGAASRPSSSRRPARRWRRRSASARTAAGSSAPWRWSCPLVSWARAPSSTPSSSIRT